MEEKLREIVATFIRIPADQIGPATPVDRRAVKSSIMLHRMYARLAEVGYTVNNYTAIKVFGDLPGAQSADAAGGRVPQAGTETPAAIPVVTPLLPGENELSVGIDIEAIESLPRVTDFRREEFYKQNFTPQEIAWCILQPEPYQSFAGIFALKEALIKADNSMRDRPFDQIPIHRSPSGKPVFPGFAISISHAGGMAVAVAARPAGNAPVLPALTVPSASSGGGRPAGAAIAWLALAAAVAALIIAILHPK